MLTTVLLYRKFIWDNVYQILSESTGFYGRYYKNILVCFFFGSQCSISSVTLLIFWSFPAYSHHHGVYSPPIRNWM